MIHPQHRNAARRILGPTHNRAAHRAPCPNCAAPVWLARLHPFDDIAAANIAPITARAEFQALLNALATYDLHNGELTPRYWWNIQTHNPDEHPVLIEHRCGEELATESINPKQLAKLYPIRHKSDKPNPTDPPF